MASEVDEAALEVEFRSTMELLSHVLVQYSGTQPVISEALKVDIGRTVSLLKSLARQFVSTDQHLRASGITRHAADLLSILGRKDEGLQMLSEMEASCYENGDFGGVLECAWSKGKVLMEAKVYPEESRRALLRCLAFANENKEKFSNLSHLNDTIKNAKYYLGKVLSQLDEFRDAIPNLMAAEHDDGFDQAAVCFNLGLTNSLAARHQITNAEDKQKSFELAVSYFRRSFSIYKAKGDTEAVSYALRAADQATRNLHHIKDFAQASEVSEEAALLAREIANWIKESTFWWNCGQMMVAQERYIEALKYFVASLEAALQTTGDQVEALIEQAFTWLRHTIFLVRGESSEEVERRWERVDLTEMSLSRVWTVDRRADAMLSLGLAKYIMGQQAQGIEWLDKALTMLDVEMSTLDTTLTIANKKLLYDIAFSLAAMHRECAISLTAMHRECGNLTAAATLFKRCKTMVENPLQKLQCALREGEALALSDQFDQSLTVLKEALGRYDCLLTSEPNTVAEVLCMLGCVLKRCGRFEEAIYELTEACRIWDETKAFDDAELPLAYMALYEIHILKQEHWQAVELAKRFQPILDRYHHEDKILLEWKALQGSAQMLIGDYDLASTKYLSVALKEAKDKGHWELQLTVLGNLARAYRGLKDYDAALDKYEELEELLIGHDGNKFVLLGAEMSINRGEVYVQKGLYVDEGEREEYFQKALQSYKTATEILITSSFTNDLQARAYAGQAALLHNLGKIAGAGEAADKALKLAGQDRILIAKLNHIQAYKFASEGAIDKAIEVARRAALCFSDVQMELQGLESAWVTFFGGDMKHMFIFLQRLYLHEEDYTTALLWAERGRMRLFQFKVEGYQTSQHLGVSESGGGSSSSAYQKRRQAFDIQASHPQIEQGAESSHQLALNEPASRKGTEGAVAVVNACESRAPQSDLISKGTSGSNIESESSHVVYGSDHDLKFPAVEASEGSERFYVIPTDCTKDKLRSQEESARRLEEEAPYKLEAGVSEDDQLWFDKDDNLAEKLILKTLEVCGNGAAIIEYMYADAEQLFITYVLLGGSNRLVHCHLTKLSDFFKDKQISKVATSLRSLIGKTLTAIKNPKQQDRALSCLQILDKLLLAPIREHIVDCIHVIFSPHEVLNRIPFAALHDGERFLIQSTSTSIIPSIRSLHRCFIKQQIFEVACENGTVGPPFVAGNPEPMGLCMGQLEGAAKEAEEVAELLGVTAVTGRNMTKEVVLRGLRSGCLCVLATHGIVDAGTYPHGALVLQNCESEVLTSEIFGDRPSVVRSSRRGLLGGRNLQRAVATASDVITAEEISALPGGIPAGLVVLSTCESGEGQVTSEGLLGLGRAVLQAGAPAAVMSLWKVNDYSTKELMTGLFTAMVKDSKTVAEALQTAMLHLLQDGSYTIYHWAPFVVFGSPFMKVPKFDSN